MVGKFSRGDENLQQLTTRYKLVKSGKVHDTYQNDKDYIFSVATDRASAFNEELGIEIPDKGKISTAISAFWSTLAEEEKQEIGMTAYLSSNADCLHSIHPYGFLNEAKFDTPEFSGRVTKMTKLKMFPVKCIVRGHLSGSAWKLYESGKREICGVRLPEGLQNGSKLPKPIFTPTSRAPEGECDKNITFDKMLEVVFVVGMGDYYVVKRIYDFCLQLYEFGYQYAAERGLILADAKFELGLDGYKNIIFGSEILTPNTAHYWDANSFAPGKEPKILGEQLIIDYLAAAKARGEENPQIPAEIIEETGRQYEELFKRLTGKPWPKS